MNFKNVVQKVAYANTDLCQCDTCGDILPTDDIHTGPDGKPECSDCRRERNREEDNR